MKALFLPGLHCRAEIWEGAPAALPGVGVVALDWPWPERLRSHDDAADWLDGEIARQGAAVVVAHSFGGIVALHLRARAQTEPEWRLVVVDSFLVTPHAFFRNHVWRPAPELRARVAAMLAEERPRFPMLSEVASAEDPPGWRERVLAKRASFVYGARSGEHDAATLGEMAGVPPSTGHEVRAIANASHFLMLEQPDAFYAAVRELVSR